VEITCEATLVRAGGKTNRRSDLNYFWRAQDPRSVAAPFSAEPARTGKLSGCDSLLTYEAGDGGNNHATTRFRRDDDMAPWPFCPSMI